MASKSSTRRVAPKSWVCFNRSAASAHSGWARISRPKASFCCTRNATLRREPIERTYCCANCSKAGSDLRSCLNTRNTWAAIRSDRVADDGAGVALDRVRSAIVEKGIVTRAVAERLPESELLQFLFLPGVYHEI